MKRHSSVALIWLLAVVVTGQSSAHEPDRESLQGLTGLYVLIANHDSKVFNDGLNIKGLRTLVESQLNESGIKVLTDEEMSKAQGMPTLYLDISTVKNSHLLYYSYNVKLTLQQLIVLKRNPDIVLSAPTWSREASGMVGVDNTVSHINMLLQRFIIDYLMANSK